MLPPKCRICGMRENNHRCQGGTPAQRVEERKRQQRDNPEEPPGHELAGPVEQTLGRGAAPEVAAAEASAVAIPRAAQPPRRRWHDDTDSAGEPVEIADYVRKPARFYAPHGQCQFCDRRRAAAARSMRAVRERGEA